MNILQSIINNITQQIAYLTSNNSTFNVHSLSTQWLITVSNNDENDTIRMIYHCLYMLRSISIYIQLYMHDNTLNTMIV